jgi:hypothetical protein
MYSSEGWQPKKPTIEMVAATLIGGVPIFNVRTFSLLLGRLS